MTEHASKTRKNLIRMAGFALLALPGSALAHTGHETTGAVHGLIHPFTGLDHLLAMLLVGLFAYQLGGRALWALPLAFLTALGLGGLLGMSAPGTGLVEIGIAVSVIVLGTAVALNLRAPVALAAAVVGFFAIFHGYAHGAEMPASASAMSYGAGFMLGTALLIAMGIGLGRIQNLAAQRAGGNLVRPAGTVAALVGVGLLTGMA